MESERETALLVRARGGDREAMTKLLEANEPLILRYGLQMCGHEADAREVLQETLLAMYKNLHTFRGEARLSTWMFQIARTFCVKQRRRRKGEPLAHLDVESSEGRALPVDESGVEARAHAREVGAIISAALDTLSPAHREAIVLRDVEGLTAEDAAAQVGLEVGAFKSRLHRARYALKRRLTVTLEVAPGQGGCGSHAHQWTAHASKEIDRPVCEAIELHLAACKAHSPACDRLERAVVKCLARPGTEVPSQLRHEVQAAAAPRGGPGVSVAVAES